MEPPYLFFNTDLSIQQIIVVPGVVVPPFYFGDGVTLLALQKTKRGKMAQHDSAHKYTRTVQYEHEKITGTMRIFDYMGRCC